ncbi:hypothetical protein [Mangrovicella endophytica]|uniref:hypothetical protein n=1 Tax=Mangrovicella endophytica TaxID=2066697 RepID=UPI000C9E8E8A|nr:hypothetical protein [Mangrovicella endophytica]
MIATGLIFLLGMLVAIFIALLVMPLVWRQAQRLARRDFEATIPTTANEIRAAQDMARAEAAMMVRRQDLAARQMRDKAAAERAEAGRIAVHNADLRQRERAATDKAARLTAEIAELRADLAAREAEIARLETSLHDTQHDLDLRSEELEALALRFRELSDIAEERKVQIVSLEAKLDRSSDDLRHGERRQREQHEQAERMRSEITALEAALKREKARTAALDEKVTRLTANLADREEELTRLGGGTSAAVAAEKPLDAVAVAPAVTAVAAPPAAGVNGHAAAETLAATDDLATLDDAELRDRIGDIAARVIRMSAIAEGPDSPILKLLGDAPAAGQGESAAQPTLADRVRLLMASDSAADNDSGRRDQRPEDAAE